MNGLPVEEGPAVPGKEPTAVLRIHAWYQGATPGDRIEVDYEMVHWYVAPRGVSARHGVIPTIPMYLIVEDK